MDPRAVIASLLHELGVPDPALSLIVAHARAVERDADRLGLVSDRGLDAVLLRHSADSLLFALARAPLPGETWVDAGSGAGFPGLVLACAFPGTRFVLIEPQQRRAGFLELQSLNLGLTGVEVTRVRIDKMPRESADVAVARALEDPAKTLPELQRCLRPGGAALVAAGPSTDAPTDGRVVDVKRPYVDSPGLVLIMPAKP